MAKIERTIERCSQCEHSEEFDSQRASILVYYCHKKCELIGWYNHNGVGSSIEIPDWCPLPDVPEELKKE